MINALIKKLWWLPGSLLLAFNLAYAGQPLETIKADCLSCHNSTTANTQFPGPQLGGFSSNYIKEQLRNFKAGHRGSGSPSAQRMSDIASNLSEEDIGRLAKWASSHDKQRLFSYQSSSAEGAELYAEKCRSCHNSFMGRTMTRSPKLDYLKPDYIEAQLNLFRQGQREFETPSKYQTEMRNVVRALSDEQLRLITGFIRQLSLNREQGIH